MTKSITTSKHKNEWTEKNPAQSQLDTTMDRSNRERTPTVSQDPMRGRQERCIVVSSLKPLESRKSAWITHNRSGADDRAGLYSTLATRRRAPAWFTATRSGSAWLTWRITWCITVVPVESSTRIPKFKKRWSFATIPEATTASWQNDQTTERSQQADKTCHRRTSR
ncbi:MAG: hypothetical protein ABGW79_00385 [Pirellulales bacterium]